MRGGMGWGKIGQVVFLVVVTGDCDSKLNQQISPFLFFTPASFLPGMMMSEPRQE